MDKITGEGPVAVSCTRQSVVRNLL